MANQSSHSGLTRWTAYLNPGCGSESVGDRWGNDLTKL